MPGKLKDVNANRIDRTARFLPGTLFSFPCSERRRRPKVSDRGWLPRRLAVGTRLRVLGGGIPIESELTLWRDVRIA